MIGRLRSDAATDRGTVRGNNEDAFVDAPASGLFAVADGAGGHAAGDVAANMLADALRTLPAQLAPDEAVAQIRLRTTAVHGALRQEAERRGDAMIATTLVALLIRAPHFACLWAGDSRAYLFRGGRLSQISRDHSLVQDLIDTGRLAPEAAERHPHAHVITRAIGAPEAEILLDKVIGTVLPGDRFLLCSDGLCKSLPDSALAAVLAAAHPRPAAALVSAALAAKARDNVTAVVVDVLGAEGEA